MIALDHFFDSDEGSFFWRADGWYIRRGDEVLGPFESSESARLHWRAEADLALSHAHDNDEV